MCENVCLHAYQRMNVCDVRARMFLLNWVYVYTCAYVLYVCDVHVRASVCVLVYVNESACACVRVRVGGYIVRVLESSVVYISLHVLEINFINDMQLYVQ